MKSRNILVLGGTGRTGHHIIRQALQAHYNVRALTRNLSKIPKFAEGDVDWTQGDSTDPQAIKKAIEGQDAILSVVGPKWIGKTTLYSDTIKAIISATKNNSGSSIRFLGVTANWDLSLAPWYHKLMAKFMTGMKEDHEKMEDILEKEGGHLQWTVIRPYELREHEKTGTYITLPENHAEENLKLITYTRDLADFMLGEAFDNQWKSANTSKAIIQKEVTLIDLTEDQSEDFETSSSVQKNKNLKTSDNQSIYIDGQASQGNSVLKHSIQKIWTKTGCVCLSLASVEGFQGEVTCSLCKLARSYAEEVRGISIESELFKKALKKSHRNRNKWRIEMIKHNTRSLDESIQQKFSEDAQREESCQNLPEILRETRFSVARFLADHIIELDP